MLQALLQFFSRLFEPYDNIVQLGQITKHFSRYEFERSDTAIRMKLDNTMPEPVYFKAKQLCEEVLEPCRKKFGAILVTSGYRGKELNRAVKGSKTSQHCKGEAADIELPNGDNWELFRYIRDNLQHDQLIAEYMIEDDPNAGWVHVSYRVGNNRNENFNIN